MQYDTSNSKKHHDIYNSSLRCRAPKRGVIAANVKSPFPDGKGLKTKIILHL